MHDTRSGNRLSLTRSQRSSRSCFYRFSSLRRTGFSIGGIGTATFGAIIIYQLLREPAERHDAFANADSGVDAETVRAAGPH